MEKIIDATERSEDLDTMSDEKLKEYIDSNPITRERTKRLKYPSKIWRSRCISMLRDNDSRSRRILSMNSCNTLKKTVKMIKITDVY